MAKALVVYATKYGSTREVAEAIAGSLGADLAEAASDPDLAGYELVVLGSPIYMGTYLPTVTEFAAHHRHELAERMVATFVTAAADQEAQPGLTGDDMGLVFTQQEYADGLARLAGGRVVASRGFGGRLRPDALDERDRNMIGWLYRFLTKTDLSGFDLIDLDAARHFGVELRRRLDA